MNVLIVDDDNIFADSLALLLESRGHASRRAASAEQATVALTCWPADVVVTDLIMPGAGGKALLESIALTKHPVPVVVLSARGPDETDDLPALPVMKVLRKPVPIEVILATIAELSHQE